MIRRAGGAGVCEISGRWIAEWIEVGLDDIAEYLGKHAAFEEWCRRHGRG